MTSNTATGSTNASDDSLVPLAGLVVLTNMLVGVVIFGGLGTGLYSIVMAAAIAVFLAGLMVGRTPEYLGKKIGPPENKMIVLYALLAPLIVLPLTAIRLITKAGLSRLTTNYGPYGLTAILFAYISRSFANSGQAFGGLNANTVFYNLTTVIAMLAAGLGWQCRRWHSPGCSRARRTHKFPWMETTEIAAPAAVGRVQSVDALRGAIMMLMAIDHIRDFMARSAMLFLPTDLTRTNPAIFFTRWITHFCVPVFMLTAGTGASLWMTRGRHTKGELSRFLITRGLWIILLEITVLRVVLFSQVTYHASFIILLSCGRSGSV